MLTTRHHIYLSLALALTATTIVVLTLPKVGMVAAEAQAQTAGTATEERNWSIAAPGLVEPNDGEIGLGVEVVGRVVAIPVSVGEKVKAGQVVIRLDDADATARIQKTQAEVEIRERDRDNVAATRRGRSRRSAADRLAETEVALFKARRDLDRLYAAAAAPTAKDVDAALKAIAEARKNRATAQQELDDINALEETPLYSRSESALELARANHTLALQAFEKTRIRAENDGTVLRINAKKGAVVSPGMPRPLAVIGDITKLRVRAEVDERSVADVKQGQKVVIRSVAFDGRDFNGSVSEIGASLAPGRIGKTQSRGPSNANVLEVILDVSGNTPLLSGMEVDVLFIGESEKAAKPADGAASTN